LDKEAETGLAQLNRGEKIPGEEVHAEIRERSRRWRPGQNGRFLVFAGGAARLAGNLGKTLACRSFAPVAGLPACLPWALTSGRLSLMKSNTLALDLESDSLFRTLVERFGFAESAREWSRCRQRLTAWEDEHLLVENPPPDKLERHRKTVERLMFFGQLFMLVASHPDFDDMETAEMIRANMEALRDKLRMYHSPMGREQADMILREVFPES